MTAIMNLHSSALLTSIRPIVWISRCFGLLPVIWNATMCEWQVAPWYHPQSIYFACLLLLRLVVYGAMSYALLMTPSQFWQSPTLVLSFILECIFIWLRIIVAPYGVAINLSLIGEVQRNLQEVDAILNVKNQKKFDWKTHKCTILMTLEVTIAIALMLTFTRHFITWYNRFIPNYCISQLIVTWYFVDFVTEVTVLIQFCISSILLQQRITAIRKHLPNYTSTTSLTESLKGEMRPSLKQLRFAYILLRQVSKEICKSFGWTVLAISLGETMVLTNNFYGMARRLLGIALAKQKSVFKEEYYFIITIICHATFLLTCLFYYADQINEEVAELEMDLDILTLRTTQNSAEIKKELADLHQTVSSNPLEKITAAKFYDVGRRSIPAVLGAILTYFVVLIQFEGSERFGNYCPCNGSITVS